VSDGHFIFEKQMPYLNRGISNTDNNQQNQSHSPKIDTRRGKEFQKEDDNHRTHLPNRHLIFKENVDLEESNKKEEAVKMNDEDYCNLTIEDESFE